MIGDLWSAVFTVTTLSVILTKVAPLLLAALGGAVTQKGDILNIGLEGMMLIGAFTAITVGGTTDNWVLGVIAAAGAAFVVGLIYAFASLVMNADYIVVGIGINTLAFGTTVLGLTLLYGNPGQTPRTVTSVMPKIDLGPVAQLPIIGPALNNQTPLVWLAFACVPLYGYLLYRTRYGVHLRAVGEDVAAATAAGIRAKRVQFGSVLLCGVLCGLAGAQLSMATLGQFTTNMTAGRGFIAVAALTFGQARPTRTLIACVLFGAADTLADRLGISGFNPALTQMTPYVITVLALVFAALRTRSAIRARSTEALNAAAAS